MTSSHPTSHDVISCDKVEGTNVYNMAADKLGSIDDLMIDKRSGQVRDAVMKFGGFLGIDTGRYPIPWNMLNYDTDKDARSSPSTSRASRRRPSTRTCRSATASTASASTAIAASTGRSPHALTC